MLCSAFTLLKIETSYKFSHFGGSYVSLINSNLLREPCSWEHVLRECWAKNVSFLMRVTLAGVRPKNLEVVC